MLMKMKSLWIALIVIREVLSFEKGYYTIIAPGNVRSESIFHVSFTLNQFHKSCWFNITLTSYNDNHEYRYDSIEVKPGTTKLVELYAPYFDSQIANLDIYGYKGIISKDSDIMFVYTEPKWMFIQTNKIIYKPGDEVEFRVIYIDQLKRPAKINDDKIITVEILDDESNIIMVFYDIKFVQGVFKGKFQLSDYPVLGDWYIELKIDGDFQTIKKFEVDRYNLPKFNVQINTKEQVSIYDKQLELEISTRKVS
ncbi:thioester-containing protein 1 allele R1-like [Episyrphus balteatus]|uniref:thioester-containing protein 1 allele R1-like n=1 Tax=Episyrphus balteatus TaxID=286459 RepID=UPI002485E331|nr:thioester-containing protein 1 allele R1-like [Episyrphus balteatus]